MVPSPNSVVRTGFTSSVTECHSINNHISWYILIYHTKHAWILSSFYGCVILAAVVQADKSPTINLIIFFEWNIKDVIMWRFLVKWTLYCLFLLQAVLPLAISLQQKQSTSGEHAFAYSSSTKQWNWFIFNRNDFKIGDLFSRTRYWGQETQWN